MILVIDVGNSSTKIGVFQKDIIIAKWRITTIHQHTEDEYASKVLPLLNFLNIDLMGFKGAVISSVVNGVTNPIAIFIEKYFKITPLIANEIQHDLILKIDNPKKLGSDILANAIATNRLYKETCIFIDFGTALVIGVITKEKELLGVTISPGMQTSYDSLINKTDLLPYVQLSSHNLKQTLGKNTEDAIKLGIYSSYIETVNGIVKKIYKEHGVKLKTIITGEFAEIIYKQIISVDIYEPNLTLEGLKFLYNFN